MKKKIILFLSLCLLSAAVYALAAGDASDPLASLSYLNGTFTSKVNTQVDEKLDASDAALLSGSGADPAGSGSVTTDWAECRLKSGDTLVGQTGTSVLLLAGSGSVTFGSGAVVDVTTGSAVTSGSPLTVNHRYLTAEDTTATFTVTSKTAVLDYQGPYSFTYSSAVDYNAMAGALKTLHLFQGSFTGYGQGYDLEVAPTRLQALIMFIRVLGEEDAALAWSGSTPFTDIAAGTQAAQYVGYAYEKGYTNGYTATSFRPAGAVNAYQYTEFVLRAMGYSSASNTDLASTLIRAVSAGVLTMGEAAQLQADTFLRAELVYISYYALEAELPSGEETLADRLMDLDVFTRSEWRSARELVSTERL